MRSPGLFCSVFFGVFMGLTVFSAILKTKNRTVKPFWLHGAGFYLVGPPGLEPGTNGL